MKTLGIFGLVSLGLILSLVFYSCTILQEYEAVEYKINQDYIDVDEALRASPPRTEGSPAPFTEQSFGKWLAAREAVTKTMKEGLDDPDAITTLLVRRVRNDALKTLHESIVEQGLDLWLYNRMAFRWRSLIARAEFDALRKAWAKDVRVASRPDPLPLEEPAQDITDVERSLLKKYEARLIASLSADQLTVLLELIAAGQGPSADRPEQDG